MKKTIFSLFVVLAAISFASCQDKGQKADDKTADSKGNTSYAFGVSIGNSIKSTAVTIDYDQFIKGIKDVLEKNAPTMTEEQASDVIQAAITAASAKKGEENLKKEADFLAENGKKTGVITTASGLQYQILKDGTGDSPKATDTVKVDYVGTLLDGTTFDSSIARGTPAEFPLNRVIPGWTEGIQLMKTGGKAKFWIPSKLGYGSTGAGGVIGPNETLIFEVDLLGVTAAAK